MIKRSDELFFLQHLGALLITQQVIQQVQESLLPYIMHKTRVTKVSKEGKKLVVKTVDFSDDIERQGTQEVYLVRNTVTPNCQNTLG